MFPALDSILNSGKKNPGRFLRSGLTTRGLDFYAERLTESPSSEGLPLKRRARSHKAAEVRLHPFESALPVQPHITDDQYPKKHKHTGQRVHRP